MKGMIGKSFKNIRSDVNQFHFNRKNKFTILQQADIIRKIAENLFNSSTPRFAFMIRHPLVKLLIIPNLYYHTVIKKSTSL